jgi:hypothetical protein
MNRDSKILVLIGIAITAVGRSPLILSKIVSSDPASDCFGEEMLMLLSATVVILAEMLVSGKRELGSPIRP